MIEPFMTSAKQWLPDWPEWALDVLLVMTACLIVTLAITSFYTPEDEKDEEKKEDPTKTTNGNGHHKTTKELHTEFNAFRHRYISVYLVIMLADWMQGTHMYTLYQSYNVNISALFLTGFLSGAIFAPVLGSAVDKFGRKRSCIVYCILEIIINILEHSTNFTVLFMGRVLGGISTNLLFSAFESWMTTAHRQRGYPEEWLSRTYSEASIGNGAMAILAGIVAQVLEDFFGHIGPFQGAIALTVLALLMVIGWEENYGEEQEGKHCKTTMYDQFKEGWKTTVSDSRVWRIGLTQAFSEGGMYTFVFMWVPTLLAMEPPGGVPTGCVFSSMMMAITMGGVLFPPLKSLMSTFSQNKACELSATLIYFLASCSMAIPAYCFRTIGSGDSECFWLAIVSFMVIELCVGLFMPVAGTLRSKYIPDAQQGCILNIFRLPLNVFVVYGTHATDTMEPSSVFMLVSAWFFLASFLQATMIVSNTEKTKAD